MTPQCIRSHLDALAKPPGSLGRLEDLATRLCAVQQTLTPRTTPRFGIWRTTFARSRPRLSIALPFSSVSRW